MTDSRRLHDLTVDEFNENAKKIVRDIPPGHFIDAVDKMFQEKVRTLGIELTGKDITDHKEVLCIRKTFDESQKCRINKEKVKDAVIKEGTKNALQWVGILIAMALSVIGIKWGKI